MSESVRDDLVVRIERLESANRRWKSASLGAVLAVVVLLGLTAYAFSQRPLQGQPQAQAGSQFTVDATTMSTTYANFCRVTGTPEELILDFGLNAQMTEQPAEPVKLTNRLVMNYYTAKRLLGALQMGVQQHENVYGVLELDIQKRARTGAVKRPGERE
jgi:hypothetical protein